MRARRRRPFQTRVRRSDCSFNTSENGLRHRSHRLEKLRVGVSRVFGVGLRFPPIADSVDGGCVSLAIRKRLTSTSYCRPGIMKCAVRSRDTPARDGACR